MGNLAAKIRQQFRIVSNFVLLNANQPCGIIIIIMGNYRRGAWVVCLHEYCGLIEKIDYNLT